MMNALSVGFIAGETAVWTPPHGEGQRSGTILGDQESSNGDGISKGSSSACRMSE